MVTGAMLAPKPSVAPYGAGLQKWKTIRETCFTTGVTREYVEHGPAQTYKLVSENTR